MSNQSQGQGQNPFRDAAQQMKQSLDRIAQAKDNPQQVQQAVEQAKQQLDQIVQQGQQQQR